MQAALRMVSGSRFANHPFEKPEKALRLSYRFSWDNATIRTPSVSTLAPSMCSIHHHLFSPPPSPDRRLPRVLPRRHRQRPPTSARRRSATGRRPTPHWPAHVLCPAPSPLPHLLLALEDAPSGCAALGALQGVQTLSHQGVQQQWVLVEPELNRASDAVPGAGWRRTTRGSRRPTRHTPSAAQQPPQRCGPTTSAPHGLTKRAKARPIPQLKHRQRPRSAAEVLQETLRAPFKPQSLLRTSRRSPSCGPKVLRWA